jgi:hypothetical protein
MTRVRIRDHIRNTLGPITREWEEENDGARLPFSIVEVAGQPTTHAVTFATVGLSDAALHFPSGKLARQELVFACHDSSRHENIHGLLGVVALDRTKDGNALARGEVKGPAGLLPGATRLEALYASLPAYFPDSFALARSTEPATHFLWLIPITVGEAEFVRREGWSRFEDLIVQQDPDLLDLERSEIELPRLHLES